MGFCEGTDVLKMLYTLASAKKAKINYADGNSAFFGVYGTHPAARLTIEAGKMDLSRTYAETPTLTVSARGSRAERRAEVREQASLKRKEQELARSAQQQEMLHNGCTFDFIMSKCFAVWGDDKARFEEAVRAAVVAYRVTYPMLFTKVEERAFWRVVRSDWDRRADVVEAS